METDSEKGQSLVELVIFVTLLAVSLLVALPKVFARFERQVQSISLTKEVSR